MTPEKLEVMHRDEVGYSVRYVEAVEAFRKNTYDAGWHRGWAAGFASAAIVSLVVVFIVLVFDSFDKSISQPVKNEIPKRTTGK